MDGRTALRYARTRNSGGGDFDRAKRQQQVLRAVFDKITQLKMLPQLVTKAPGLWQALHGAIETDLGLDQIVALANLATEIAGEDIRSGVMDEHYTQFWTTPSGQQVLIPVRERMRELRDYIFTSEMPSPEIDDPAARLQAEAATIAVLNGTTTGGLAGRTTELMVQNGLQVTRTDNADLSDYSESLIIVYTGKNYTAEYIAHLLNLPLTAVVHGADDGAENDIAVILGADYVPPLEDTLVPEAASEQEASPEGEGTLEAG
jgi:hypothetical protein